MDFAVYFLIGFIVGLILNKNFEIECKTRDFDQLKNNRIVNNQYQWVTPDMVNTYILKRDIEELSYIWSRESKEIIDNINNRPNGYIYISQEDLRLLINKLYDNTKELAVHVDNNLNSD